MREDGAILNSGTQIASTLMCVHCNMHWEYVPGSGRKRGWCLKCMGPTCGGPGCATCIPLEARLEHAEGKTTPYTPLILDQFGIPVGKGMP